LNVRHDYLAEPPFSVSQGNAPPITGADALAKDGPARVAD
jgi:hypothetical protein